MIVNLTNPNGTKLFTKGTIVTEDITIIPNLPSGGDEELEVYDGTVVISNGND